MFHFFLQRRKETQSVFAKFTLIKKTPQCDVSTKILCYKNISYFNTPPSISQFLKSLAISHLSLVFILGVPAIAVGLYALSLLASFLPAPKFPFPNPKFLFPNPISRSARKGCRFNP